MNQEKLVESSEYTEEDELIRLYKEVYELGGVVRETKQSQGFLTCVGDEEHFRAALQLGPDEAITQEALEELPLILLFAHPGVGETRVEALNNAFSDWRADKETIKSGRDLYGSFEIADGTMCAYMPASSSQKREWTIEFIREGEVVFTSHVEMMYEPIFGADAEDVAALNEKIEELITQYGLEP